MRRFKKIFIFFISVLYLSANLHASYFDNSIRIWGQVTDESGTPLYLANIEIDEYNISTVTDQSGFFTFTVADTGKIVITVSMLGFSAESKTVNLIKTDSTRVDFSLKTSFADISEVTIFRNIERAGNMTRIDFKTVELLPSAGNTIENLLITMPGVSGRGEFSQQYTVRGGNFDENLVYINGLEIYRPLLVHSSHKEGLTIINPDLVATVGFSSGGYSAKYGDKMSSVLDIKYREPAASTGSATASLLGGTVHFEGLTKNGKLTYLTGGRYSSNRYLMGTLEDQGDYYSSFKDIQSVITYSVSNNLILTAFGYYSGNNFEFSPSNRETAFGTFENPLQLMVWFDGKDKSMNNSFMGAFTTSYTPIPELSIHFDISIYNSAEAETFDIAAKYQINQISNLISNSSARDSVMNIGVGSFHNHARNYLDALLKTVSHRGQFTHGKNRTEWGLSFQSSSYDDTLREWQMVDSAGYSLPYNGNDISVWRLIDSKNSTNIGTFSAFIQNTGRLESDNAAYDLNGGVRLSYWDFDRKIRYSPRASLTIMPYLNPNLSVYISGGHYYQMPVYRELRNRDGVVNDQIKPQQSIHFTIGSDYFLNLWNRPFKFTSEFYYKWLFDLIPYQIDNVRIIYSGANIAQGYARGVDFKLQGDFVQGIDSWISLSFLQTKEKIIQGIESSGSEGKYNPRPTDQLVNLSLFFQDYLPNNPEYKVHLKLLYGSRLPFGPPSEQYSSSVFRMPPYRRLDLGFSKEISRSFSRNLIVDNKNSPDLWIGVEVLNLLDIKNTISYLWLQTISDNSSVPGQFAIPNYLSGRRINLRLTAKF